MYAKIHAGPLSATCKPLFWSDEIIPTPMPDSLDTLSDITLHLLRTLASGGDMRVRWHYGIPAAAIDGFALLPSEYYAFAKDLSHWEIVTAVVDGQSLTYTVQKWSLVEEREVADTNEYTEMQFVIEDEGRDWLNARSSA